MKTFFLAITLGTAAFATDFARLLDMNALRWGMMQEKKHLNFAKEATGHSDGYLCDGSHYFKVSFDADMKDADFDLQDSYIEVRLDLANLYGRADGKYRSQNSLCIPVSGWLGLSSDWARIEARLHLEEQPNSEYPKVRLEVLKSQLGTLHFGNGVPRWIEDTVTGIVDGILEDLWTTRLGNWIESKIAAQIQKKIEAGELP